MQIYEISVWVKSKGKKLDSYSLCGHGLLSISNYRCIKAQIVDSTSFEQLAKTIKTYLFLTNYSFMLLSVNYKARLLLLIMLKDK